MSNELNTPHIAVVERRIQRERREKILAIIASFLLLAAWLYGYLHKSTLFGKYLSTLIPNAARFEQKDSIWIAYGVQTNGNEPIIGYIGLGKAPGYGGPLNMLVAINTDGKVIAVQVIDHSDTPAFFHIVAKSEFLKQFLGKSYQDSFNVGEDIDGVTGATLTSTGIANAVRQAAQDIAVQELGLSVRASHKSIEVGIAEATLVTLYIVAYIAHRSRFRFKKWARWATLTAGIVILGFWLNRPLTIAQITSLIAGYWPDYHQNLYWFLLLGGILFAISIDGKNPYCSWFCPFGAVQECLHIVGKGNWSPPRTYIEPLKWAQRCLAFLAIFFGLALRQPGATSYEIFGVIFDFKGTDLQWGLLFIVLFASLIMYRPWCQFLCPLHPIIEIISAIRRWITDIWRSLWK
jgi:hypothetical protein